MALPTFFIIGAGKAGTTSLHYYLDQHPEVQMSSVKETNFFAGEDNGKPYAMGQVASLEKYERLFDGSFAMRGEASTTYTSHPIRQGAPLRIKRAVPEARFIYLVRDPVARTISHHQHLVGVGVERRSLPEVLGDLSDPMGLPETCYSFYAAQLERYLEHFPKERVLVVDQSELLANRRATLRRIFEFLSVDADYYSPSFDDELYKSEERRVYPALYERLLGRYVIPVVQRVPRDLRHSVRARVERLLFPPLERPTVDPALRDRLKVLYAEDVARLRELSGPVVRELERMSRCG